MTSFHARSRVEANDGVEREGRLEAFADNWARPSEASDGTDGVDRFSLENVVSCLVHTLHQKSHNCTLLPPRKPLKYGRDIIIINLLLDGEPQDKVR